MKKLKYRTDAVKQRLETQVVGNIFENPELAKES